MAFIILTSFLLYEISHSSDAQSYDKPHIIFNTPSMTNCVIGEADCNTAIFANEFVNGHNKERSLLATGIYGDSAVSNMLKMEWDQNLANRAQQYAESCLDIDEDNQCPPPESFDGGINFYWNTIRGDLTVSSRIELTISYWKKYITEYVKENDNIKQLQFYQANGIAEDRWLQMVRATTWKLGCGLADFPNIDPEEKEIIEVMACFYANTKFKKGDEIFKIGKSCELCPSGTQCLNDADPAYEEKLCEVEPGKCPITENDYKLVEQNCLKSTNVKKNENILWECDLKNYGDDCKIEQPCPFYWDIDLIEHSKATTVKGDCVSANLLKDVIKIEKSSCFKFQYIKVENGIQSRHCSVMGFIVNLNSGESIQVVKYEDANHWTDVNIDIPWTETNIQVGIFVKSSSENVDKQNIKVGNFRVFQGSCPPENSNIEE